MSDRRELQRHVMAGDSELHFALRWAEATLKEWVRDHGEAMLSVCEPRRSLDQNAKMWPMLQDVARQVPWTVLDESGTPQNVMLSKEEWKELFTAQLTKQRAVPGIDGGWVMLGSSTRRMGRSVMRQLIELIYAFGDTRGVTWSEPAKKAYREITEKAA